jgi:hypothetical protein
MALCQHNDSDGKFKKETIVYCREKKIAPGLADFMQSCKQIKWQLIPQLSSSPTADRLYHSYQQISIDASRKQV